MPRSRIILGVSPDRGRRPLRANPESVQSLKSADKLLVVDLQAAQNPTMTEEQLLQEFEALAERLDIPVTYAALDEGSGGLCQVRGRSRFIIDRDLDVRSRNDIFACEFARLPLDGVFVLPIVRQRINQHRTFEA